MGCLSGFSGFNAGDRGYSGAPEKWHSQSFEQSPLFKGLREKSYAIFWGSGYMCGSGAGGLRMAVFGWFGLDGDVGYAVCLYGFFDAAGDGEGLPSSIFW